MGWKRLLSYISGSVDQELLLRNEYLTAENRILRQQIKGNLKLTDGERKTLAEIGKRLGRKALEEVATIVRPETILGWHRKLIARKFDGSRNRSCTGRPKTERELEQLVVRLAGENRSWGYDRIVGALCNLGYTVSSQTVGNILRRNGISPAPERRKRTTWKEFILSHRDLLVATDFFSAEVWTASGLVSYFVLFFIRIRSREVHVAGIAAHPDESWMSQIARNITMVDWGFLRDGDYLIHDRDGKYCSAFQKILEEMGIKLLILPARSPNLNAFAERWVGSIKRECLSNLIFFGEGSLRRTVNEYVAHYHKERNHQGKGNELLMAGEKLGGRSAGSVRCRERLGGMLKYYHREAA